MRWEIIDKSLSFKGFFQLVTYRLKHALFSGGMSGELNRELFVRGEAAAVLPYDAVNDTVVLIEQFRIGALDSPQGAWMTEIVAGSLEPGESTEEVARREAMEEAGCIIDELIPVCQCYSSPGSSDERVSIFVGRTDSTGLGGIHGLAEEGEDIRATVVPADEALAQLHAGIIESAVPIIALQWLELHRDELRDQWR